jgi:hypothetical protein
MPRKPPATTADLTIEILKQIRDAATVTNQRLESLENRLDGRLESVETRLGRVEHGLNDLGTFMRDLALAQAKHERFHAQHVEVLERDVANLKDRLAAVEKRLADQ